ncbi:MAG: Gfo/Idh/MocA family oxidoreductase [FCB group bacterium]|jgi:predicted dehydrogenase|nr:Gfo/Idh/MocA family oxidoreductase [FCB group bacterium]
MVKVGIVGCGGIAREHCKHLSAMDNVKFVGHCDIDETRARALADTHGGDAFTDFETLYDKAKPDAVFVCVPPYAHVGMEEAALDRGIHLFIEKPVAIDRVTARRIAASMRNTNSIVSVGYCYRYYDTVNLARQLLKGKAVSLITAAWNGGMPEVWWWRRMDTSGGQIVEQSTHLVDLIRYLCGEVAEVNAVAATGCMTHVKDFSTHDSTVLTMRLKSGAVATLASSCVTNYGGRISVEIITPEATFTLANGRLIVHEAGKVTEYHPAVNMFREEDEAFIDAVRHGRRGRIKSTYNDALKTFYVTCAANESLQSGMPVKP